MKPFKALRMRTAGAAPPIPPADFTVDELTPLFLADASPASVIVANGTGGDWDLHIREIGNVVDTGVVGAQRYVLTYTGHNAGTYSESTVVYIGWAYSSDGLSWTKGGKLLTTADLEDPWLMKVSGTWYLFCENKGPSPQVIQLYTSSDLSSWTDQGTVLSQGTGWESVDVSSPVVWVEGATWHMLYEGRSGANGSFGKATASAAAGPWTKDGSNPILVPGDISWATTFIVPDDIWLADDGVTYVVPFHGNSVNGTERARCGVLHTTDFATWTDPWDNRLRFETWDHMSWQYHPIGEEMQFIYNLDAGAGIIQGPHMGHEVLVMNFTGSNGSTTMTDESPWAHSFTAVGNAQIQSNKLELDGSGDYITSASNERWKLANLPYTIELFGVAFDSNASLFTMISQWLSPSSFNWRFDYRGDLSPDILRMLALDSSSVQFFDDSSSWTPTVSTGYNLCIERDASNNCRFYVDGTMLTKTTQSERFLGNAAALIIGANSNGGVTNYFDGRFDAVRMNVGKALYANDGGYTVPGLPLVPA